MRVRCMHEEVKRRWRDDPLARSRLAYRRLTVTNRHHALRPPFHCVNVEGAMWRASGQWRCGLRDLDIPRLWPREHSTGRMQGVSAWVADPRPSTVFGLRLRTEQPARRNCDLLHAGKHRVSPRRTHLLPAARHARLPGGKRCSHQISILHRQYGGFRIRDCVGGLQSLFFSH